MSEEKESTKKYVKRGINWNDPEQRKEYFRNYAASRGEEYMEKRRAKNREYAKAQTRRKTAERRAKRGLLIDVRTTKAEN